MENRLEAVFQSAKEAFEEHRYTVHIRVSDRMPGSKQGCTQEVHVRNLSEARIFVNGMCLAWHIAGTKTLFGLEIPVNLPWVVND